MLIITPSKINITSQPASGYTWTAYGRRSASDFCFFSFPSSPCRLSKRLHLGNAYLGKKHMGGMHCQELGRNGFYTTSRSPHTRAGIVQACMLIGFFAGIGFTFSPLPFYLTPRHLVCRHLGSLQNSLGGLPGRCSQSHTLRSQSLLPARMQGHGQRIWHPAGSDEGRWHNTSFPFPPADWLSHMGKEAWLRGVIPRANRIWHVGLTLIHKNHDPTLPTHPSI